MIALLVLVSAALAAAPGGRHTVVRTGDTVESIAASLDLDAATIRSLNDLGADAQPTAGRLLHLPGDEGSQDALLLSMSGGVIVTRPGADPVPGEAADALPIGTTICTAPASYATIRLAVTAGAFTHDDVSMLAETCLTIDGAWSDARQRSSLVSLGRGSIRVRPAEAGGGVTVQSEAGVTSGVSGGYRVTTERGAARTEALSGGVSVFGAGVEVALAPGQGSRVREGEPPSPPVVLLAGGSPLFPEEGQPLRRPDFAWSSVDRALGYRVEIAVSKDFSDVVHVEETPENAWSPDYLFVPFRVPGLWWRVSSFDRMGFLGTESEPRYLRFPAGVGP